MSNYQVLARKYRPKNFYELIGQNHVCQALTNAIDTQRLHHAYLFTGTRGVGKTTIARILAKCLNCETGITSTPCGVCDVCISVDDGRFIDLIEIDAASRTKVEDTRDLLENVPYAPTQGRYKVYLIDEVHMLSTHSFNALLKTLEEPPEHTKFILATTDPQKLPVTIISRCLQFVLRPLPQEMLYQHLMYILNQEQVGFCDKALWQLAKSAKGSVRDALSLTDQAIAFGGGVLTEDTVTQMLGLVDSLDIVALIEDIFTDNRSNLTKTILKMRQQMVDAIAILDDIADTLHDLAMIQTLPDVPLDMSANQAESLLALAKQVSPTQLQLFYTLVNKSREEAQLATTPMQALEMTIIRMIAFDYVASNQMPQTSSNENLANENLANENLANENLANENLANENLANENLANENLANENLANENLANENLANENLANENLANENLANENLANENLANENLANENLANENLANENLANENLANENLANENLANENLANENLANENLANENLANENLANENLANENLANENLANENLANENLANENLANENLANENLANENLANENLANENLANENLANENLANENLANENLANENLANENLANENLANENLANENLANENLANPTRIDSHLPINQQQLSRMLKPPVQELTGVWTADKWDYWLSLARENQWLDADELALASQSIMMGSIDGECTFYTTNKNMQTNVTFKSFVCKFTQHFQQAKIDNQLHILSDNPSLDVEQLPKNKAQSRQIQVYEIAQRQIMDSPNFQLLYQQGYLDAQNSHQMIKNIKLTFN